MNERKSMRPCQYDDHYMNGLDTCQCGKYKREPEEDYSMCQDSEFAKVYANFMRMHLDVRRGIKD